MKEIDRSQRRARTGGTQLDDATVGKRPRVARYSARQASEMAAADTVSQPIPSNLRARFENSLGMDLGDVTLHTGAESAEAAAAVGAKAFAVGKSIHFGAGRFNLSTGDGQRLLAHEVAHTAQQDPRAPVRQNADIVSSSSDAAELEADAAIPSLLAGSPISLSQRPGPATLSRDEDKDAPQAPSETEETEETEDGLTEADKSKLTAMETANKAALAKISVITSSASAVAAAVKEVRASGMSAAAHRAASAAKVVERRIEASDKLLASLDATEIEQDPEAREQARSRDELETQLAPAVSKIMSALSIGGAGGGGGGNGAAIVTKARALSAKLQKISAIKASAAALTGKTGEQQRAGVQKLKGQLAALGADKSFAMPIVTGAAPPEVASALRGNSAALQKKIADEAREKLGDSSKASSSASAPTNAAKLEDPHKKILDTDHVTNKVQGASKKTQERVEWIKSSTSASVDSDGNIEAGVEGEVGKENADGDRGKLSASGGADVGLREDGSIELQGVKFEPGYTMAGSPKGVEVSFSGGVSRNVTVNPPMFNGEVWIVSYQIDLGASLGASGKKSGAKVGGKASGTRSYGGSRSFKEQNDAKAFYDKSGFTSMDLPAGIPDIAEINGMQEGETRSEGTSGELGVSGEASGVSVGGGFGGGEEIELEKTGPQKVSVTIKGSTAWKASGGAGTTGLSFGVGGSSSSATSTVVTFDLSTASGKSAYEAWQGDPGTVPAAGPGVTLVSTGEGSAESRQEALAIGPGKGSDTYTTGEFTEKTADGKQSTETIYGSWNRTSEQLEIDGDKKYGVGNDKRSETHTAEIVTTETGKTELVVSTEIDTQDAGDASGVLAGETDGISKYWKEGEKSSGKWAVKSTYSQEKLDEFAEKVENGAPLGKDRTGAGTMRINHGAKLRERLQNAKSEKEKREAITAWYAEMGPDARKDLNATIGPPDDVEISLANDKVMSGAIGQAKFDAAWNSINNSLASSEDPEYLRKLQSDAQQLIASENGRVRHIQNPSNYPELPDTMRKMAWGKVNANVKRAFALEKSIRIKLSKTTGDDTNFPPEVTAAWSAAAKARGAMESAMAIAQNDRNIHEGKGALSKISAREKIHATKGIKTMTREEASKLTKDGKGISGSQMVGLARGMYAEADGAWSAGLVDMQEGEADEAAMFQVATEDEQSVEAAVKAGNAAAQHFDAAAGSYARASKLYRDIAVGLRGQMGKQFQGYDGDSLDAHKASFE